MSTDEYGQLAITFEVSPEPIFGAYKVTLHDECQGNVIFSLPKGLSSTQFPSEQ